MADTHIFHKTLTIVTQNAVALLINTYNKFICIPKAYPVYSER